MSAVLSMLFECLSLHGSMGTPSLQTQRAGFFIHLLGQCPMKTAAKSCVGHPCNLEGITNVLPSIKIIHIIS